MRSGTAVLVLLAACSSNDDDTRRALPPCVTDATEPNETWTAATGLGAVHDDDVFGSEVVGAKPNETPNEIERYFSVSATNDVDWYQVDVQDTGINGDPQMRVMVDHGFEATAFFVCGHGKTNTVACGLGTKVAADPDIPDALGCLTAIESPDIPSQLTMQADCDGSDEGGRLLVRVKSLAPRDACQLYYLQVSVE